MSRWESLFADLEGILEEAGRAEELGSVPDRVRRDRGTTDLPARLAASTGEQVGMHLRAGARVVGVLQEVGPGWAALELGVGLPDGPLAVVVLGALTRCEGLGPSARPAEVASRRSLGSVLRALARDRRPVRLTDVEGVELEGVLLAVGADHVELAVVPVDVVARSARLRRRVLVPFAALAMVRQV